MKPLINEEKIVLAGAFHGWRDHVQDRNAPQSGGMAALRAAHEAGRAARGALLSLLPDPAGEEQLHELERLLMAFGTTGDLRLVEEAAAEIEGVRRLPDALLMRAAHVYHPEGRTEVFTYDRDQGMAFGRVLGTWVGGHIEAGYPGNYPAMPPGAKIFVNEEGTLLGLPRNLYAERLLLARERLLGTVVVLRNFPPGEI